MDALQVTRLGLNGCDGRSFRPRFIPALAFATLAAILATQGAQTSDFAVQVSAQVSSSPPQIDLSWPQDSSGDPSAYTISKKLRDATDWAPVITLPGTTTRYSDSAVSLGGAYEYQVQKIAGGYNGFGYVYAGIEVPCTHNRGRIILIVDSTHSAASRLAVFATS